MSTDQVLLGVGLILVLAVGSQVLASRLRIPALILLLPVGFAAGAITGDVNPQQLLGAAFQPLVSLAVAVILYDAGLGLDLAKLRGHTRRVVRRLIAVGVPVTWAFAGLLLGMPVQAAVMTGAILVVSGPTVVGPLLRFIRPTERLQRVLLTGEDDFNALAATILAGNDETTVYRLAPRHPSHGVIAPFTGGQTIFAPGLTRDAITLRY